MESKAPDTQHIWKELGEEGRMQAASAFYSDSTLKEFHRAADMFIARNKNFRPAFVKKLTTEKPALYLATLGVPQGLMGQLLVSYHFTYERGMLSAVLNALGIPQADGVIDHSARA